MDGMRDLLAEDYTLRMYEGASRSRPPQIAIPLCGPAVPACPPQAFSLFPTSSRRPGLKSGPPPGEIPGRGFALR